MVIESIAKRGGDAAMRKVVESARPDEATGANVRVILTTIQFVLLVGAIIFVNVVIVRTVDLALDALFS